MKKTATLRFFYLPVIIALLLISSAAMAQAPVIKVDLNQTGRQDLEVNEPQYTSWPIKGGAADSLTVSGIKFKFSRVGTVGTSLASNWYKAGIQSPYYARLVCDGLTVKDGNAGAQIEMRISGLAAGPHTLLTYHNTVDNILTNTDAPIDIYVNGALTVDNLFPSNRSVITSAVNTAYLHLDAIANQDVVILFAADKTTSDLIKNVFINGFELNTVNNIYQARLPFPTDGDEHLDADNGTIQLRWSKADSAVSHQVYYGTNALDVAAATIASPLYKGSQTDTFYSVSSLYSMLTYYWRIDEIDVHGVKTKGNVWYFRPRQLAFKDAEGYGRYARGGRNGKVVEVTNLNDNGPGSLRAAVTNNIGPRTIVFSVSGIIALESRLVLNQPYVTVAGQTAPGKGITIRKAPFGVTGNDVVMRHIRVRLGGGTTFDGMGLTGCDHSIIDHSSISWTIDEAFSSRGAKNITLQRTLISEALNVAGHQNYPAGTAHGYAASIGGSFGSFHHNLLAHCYGRNWSLAGGLDGANNLIGKLDITNNVVYNWGSRTTDGGANQVNFVNNYYKPGAGTTYFYALNAQHEGIGIGMQQYYFDGNVMPGRFDETNQAAGRTFSGTVAYPTFLNTAFFPSYTNTQSAGEAYKRVLSDVGSNQPVFDDHDIRMVNETLGGTYTYSGSVSNKPGFPDNEQDVGGYESYPVVTRAADFDSDHDGLPNWWEVVHGLNAYSVAGDFSDSNADTNMDGYTNLDEYLEWMSAPHFTATIGQPLNIDLKKLSRGYPLSPSFTASAVLNGQVTIATNDSIAHFISLSDGMASFNFTVTDAQGSTMTRSIGIYVQPGIVLPVSLADFEATRKNPKEVVLNWKTTQEINNDHFDIVRSFDAMAPGKIVATVKTRSTDGNSNTRLDYQVTDVNDFNGKSYYRLVQKDKDGNSKTSAIKMVNGNSNAAVLQVWPVPTRGKLFVSMANAGGNGIIQVYDVAGRQILQKAIANNTIQEIFIAVSGTCFLKVIDAKGGDVLFNKMITVGKGNQ